MVAEGTGLQRLGWWANLAPMASPERRSGGGSGDGFGADLGPAAVKGGVLIVVAILLGAFLLFRGIDSDSGVDVAAGDGDENGAEDAGSEGQATETTNPDAGGQETTTTAAPTEPPPRGEVTVLVANASGIPQAASTISDELAGAGFVTAEPANTTQAYITETGGQTTVVYYLENFEAAAADVASVLGLDVAANPDLVQAMPDPLPVDDMRGSTVLVALGADLAPTG